ncbi:intermembrane lipid transfer protein VPS13D-like isoform X2 [Oncorhynchus keta]|uniref:intermembrane lipid transfer protein VPS13D-like isoform X2 n=1 Tax=Oncorhynchus keta TaxID=8018 RepID=UPI00227BDEAA|nr:intermembrane lipid transfer protein VPS13D-like isoform X2 [Oncorhynchus keta]
MPTHTHELKLLLVRVGGWEQVKLVSVDKVVVFYRYATLLTQRWRVLRVRKPSCCKGPQGLQARSSSTQAYGQEQLFHLTDNIHSEL